MNDVELCYNLFTCSLFSILFYWGRPDMLSYEGEPFPIKVNSNFVVDGWMQQAINIASKS